MKKLKIIIFLYIYMDFEEIAKSICGADTPENIQNINILYDKYKNTPDEFIYAKRTLLMYMCMYSKYFYEKIEQLLKYGADPNICDNNNMNCLIYACSGLVNKTGDPRILDLLFTRCDYPNVMKNTKMMAYGFGLFEVVKVAQVAQIAVEENKQQRRKIAELESTVADLTTAFNNLAEKVREIDFRPPYRGNAEYEAANSRFNQLK